MHRRDFIRLTSGAAIVAPVMLSGCSSSPQATRNTAGTAPAFGLQLSTITPLLIQDFESALKEVARIGYTQVEFSAMGFIGRPVERIRELLRENNLEAPVGRVTPPLPEGFFDLPQQEMFAAFMALSAPENLLTNVRHSLKNAQYLGQESLNIPAMMPPSFQSIEGVQNNIELLKQAGEICAGEGVLLGYHNRDWEFAPIEDGAGKSIVPYDQLLAQTDSQKVAFQLDAYWMSKAGADLYDYLAKHKGRFSSCHLKDIDANGAMADVGEGTIDWPRFISAAKASGADYFFVERDNPPEPINSVTSSFNNLSNMSF